MIGRLDRLASLFEAKLQANAIMQPTDKESVLKGVADKIKDIYRSYVKPIDRQNLASLEGANRHILQYLVDAGDLFAKNFTNDMTYLANDIDHLIKQPLQDQLLLEMANMRRDIIDNKQEVRNALHNSVMILKRTMRDKERENLKSKFEQTISRIENVLIEQGKRVQEYCSPEMIILTNDILSGKVKPQRIRLSDEELTNFATHPEAAKYGIDDEEVINQLIKDPNLREKLTTLINAIKRKEAPKDGPAILQAATQIIAQRPREPTPIHDMPEEQAQQAFRSKMDPGEHWSEEMNQRKKDLAQEREDEPFEDPEKLEQQIMERDKAHQERQQKQKELQDKIDAYTKSGAHQEWEAKVFATYHNSALVYKSLRREG